MRLPTSLSVLCLTSFFSWTIPAMAAPPDPADRLCNEGVAAMAKRTHGAVAYVEYGMAKRTGLAMATLDMIKLAGGEPANFLDIGGGASPERVTKSFRAVLRDKNVRAILVNVFAGINRCDWVAKGVVDAIKELEIKLPVVVRLNGTNFEEGRKIIETSGLTITSADTLAEAAQKAVAAAQTSTKAAA